MTFLKRKLVTQDQLGSIDAIGSVGQQIRIWAPLANGRPGWSWWTNSSRRPFTFGVPSHSIDQVNEGKGS